jgi:CelD/BcsL family acetyltransferase involved in cellulose biosynthesis
MDSTDEDRLLMPSLMTFPIGRARSIATGMKIRTERDRAAVEPIWADLEARYGNGALSSSWTWTSTWLDAFGDLIEHWFVIAENDGAPIGIALLTRGQDQRRGPLPVRSVHIGTAGETPGQGVWIEYNRILAKPEAKSAFVRELLRVPGIRPGGADVLQLDGFAPEEVVGLPDDRGKRSFRNCFVASLDAATDPIDSFDRETRRKLRNGMKRFTETFGDLAIEWVADTERSDQVLAELISLHQERWTSAGKPGAFASAQFRAFHDQIIRKLVGTQGVVLVRVTAGSQLIGIFYGLVERGVIYHYQWGLSAFTDNKLAPGFITGYLVIDEARKRGFTELNWLAGESRYKKDLSNSVRSLIWAEFPLSPWMHTVTGLISAKRTLRGRR